MSYISGFDSRLDENILSVYPNNCVMLSARKITQPYTTKRKTIEKKIRQLEEKFKNAIIGGKNDKKVAPIIKHKTEYKAPVYHGWGY